MVLIEQVASRSPQYTELVRLTHPSERMFELRISPRWLEEDDFLTLSSRQRDADKIADYDV